MLNRLLADLVVLIHLGFVVFVVAGSFLVLRWLYWSTDFGRSKNGK